MRKRNHIAAVLLLLGALVAPPAISSQSRSTFTRISLSKMDVLSRAALFEQTMGEVARKEGVDPCLLWTIAYNETRFQPWLTSPRRAQGLMQFMPATAARFGLSDPYDPAESMSAAARYLKYLDGLFDGRVESILAAYNAGEGTVLTYLRGTTLISGGKRINPTAQRTAGGVPPYRETIDYVAKGTRIYRWLKTQGKFERIGNDSRIYSPGSKSSPESPPSDRANDNDDVAITVLYDPRTGARYLVGGNGRTKALRQNGPVIISPEVRALPAQRARSTFAGSPP